MAASQTSPNYTLSALLSSLKHFCVMQWTCAGNTGGFRTRPRSAPQRGNVSQHRWLSQASASSRLFSITTQRSIGLTPSYTVINNTLIRPQVELNEQSLLHRATHPITSHHITSAGSVMSGQIMSTSVNSIRANNLLELEDTQLSTQYTGMKLPFN